MCNLITNNFGSINHMLYVRACVCVSVCLFVCGIDTKHICACLCVSVRACAWLLIINFNCAQTALYYAAAAVS